MLFQNIEKTYPLLSVSIFFLNNSQMFMQDVKAIWVVLGGLGHRWVVMLDCKGNVGLCVGGLDGSRKSGAIVRG